MITSASNTQVKNIIQLNQKAKKARREQGFFSRRTENVQGGSQGLDF